MLQRSEGRQYSGSGIRDWDNDSLSSENTERDVVSSAICRVNVQNTQV